LQKVLLVGGEDIHLRKSMIQVLRESNYRVAIAAPVLPIGAGFEDIEVFRYDLCRKISVIQDFKAMYQIRKICHEWQPNVIHVFDTKPTFLIPIACWNVPRMTLVRTITGMGKIFSNGGVKLSILRIVYRFMHLLAKARVDHTIFQNSVDQTYFLKNRLVNKEYISLVPGSGIDLGDLETHKSTKIRKTTREKLGIEDDVTVFVMVARLVAQKGVLEYLRAARAVRQKHPSTVFLLVGPSGKDEPDGVSGAELEKAKDDVLYIGPRRDVPDLLNASDIFVLPTKYREGVPRSMLEAMAMSLPVIASDMPGCAEAIHHGRSGLLVQPGDVSDLTQAMEQILSADVISMGKAARNDVEKTYALDKIMAAIMRLYSMHSNEDK